MGEAVRDESVRTVAGPLVARLRARVGELIAAVRAEGRWDPTRTRSTWLRR